jgi:insulysin
MSNLALIRLYTELVRDSLNEYAYDAELAGLRYNIASHKLGVSVSVSGYNDKLHVLLLDVLQRMKRLEVKEERLEVVREEVGHLGDFAYSFEYMSNGVGWFVQLRQMWENFFLGNPYQLGDYHARWMLTENLFTYREQLKELPCKSIPFADSALAFIYLIPVRTAITVKDVTEHMQTLLTQTHAHILIHGNLRKEVNEAKNDAQESRRTEHGGLFQEALRIANMAEDIIASKPLPEDERPLSLSRLLPSCSSDLTQDSLP